jgi:hypothetical protein
VYSCKKETPSQLNSQNIDQKQYENYQAYTDKLAKSLKTKEKANYEVVNARIYAGTEYGPNIDCGFKFTCGRCPGLCWRSGFVSEGNIESIVSANQYNSGERNVYLVNSSLNKSTEVELEIYLTSEDVAKDGKLIIQKDIDIVENEITILAGEYTIDYSNYKFGKATIKAIKN